MSGDIKFNPITENLRTDAAKRIAQLFPEVVADGQIDTDALEELLNPDLEEADSTEKYEFTWRGKRNAKRIADAPARDTTLITDKEKSKDWDNTNNIYVEGDNLEVLKLMQKAYSEKIKLIYVDPPYNTGHDFVYKDNYHNSYQNYLTETGQLDKEGNITTTNKESNGRFHTDWLNMMYPRLKLARNLLADDGVIFISIDDNEDANLRKICDEIFGENNFVDCITWNTRVPKNDNKGLGNIHQYILVYTKKKDKNLKFVMQKDGLDKIYNFLKKLQINKVSLPEAEKRLKEFYKKNNFDRGITLYNQLDEKYRPWGKINMSWPNSDTFGPRYEVLHPATNKPTKIPDRGWRWNKETFDTHLNKDHVIKRYDGSYICGDIWFAKDENTQPSSIKYLSDVSHMLLKTVLSLKSDGGMELERLFGNKSYFSNPKPTKLLKILANSINEKDGIYLDFFAGSSTSADAIMQLNAEDDGNRKFIMVQLPEPINENAIAYKNGYNTITDISEERIRRAGNKIKEDNPDADIDTGFKVFKLQKSTIKKWDENPENFEAQLELIHSPFTQNSTNDQRALEIAIKSGINLEASPEINGDNYHFITSDKEVFVILGTYDEKLLEKLNHERKLSNATVVLREINNGSEIKFNLIEKLKQEPELNDHFSLEWL